jgi:predicted CXXCH cytochrome family protein
MTNAGRFSAALCALLLAAIAWPAGEDRIANTPHNLSMSGPGPIKSPTETEICKFCHAPHHTPMTPLWNRNLSDAGYVTYHSPTAAALPGQPTGSSKLCLSCHDGTIALGRILTEPMPIPMSGGDRPSGRKNLGTDLSDDHPISMSYQQALSANPTRYHPLFGQAGPVQLDDNGMVQCTSCHDAHNNQFGDFLVMDNREGRLCSTCHNVADWTQSSHFLSTAMWNGAGRDPWPYTDFETVRENACANCHDVHDAGGGEHLLYFDSIAENCYSCHDGAVASADLRPQFLKPFRHRVESAIGARRDRLGQAFDQSRAGCTDCHNPHAANGDEAEAPNVSGALRAVSGISAQGSILERAQYEYEVCFKCHSRITGASLSRVIRRQSLTGDMREKFDPSAVSFHPVEVAGRNPDVPSLLPPWSESSLMYCTHCHANDMNTNAPPQSSERPPHGSNNRFLLVLPYETSDPVTESERAYALCYSCHDRLNILSDRSFPLHSLHVVLARTSCAVCHDPHGISRGEGTASHNARLINFDITVVQPDPRTGRIEYTVEGVRTGSCFLRCHNVTHSGESY